MTRCPRCGKQNRAEARFCDACGTSLVATALTHEERKIVTVLFADLVGFTATAERLDPEDVRALQDPYWRHVRGEIERHGGTVEKFIGDAVVALFGAPFAHEDDPERAVRAALAIRDWAREQETTQVRIGITSGEALVRLGAQPLAGEGMVSGDVVNTASRLQAAAPANGILVDEATCRATTDMIDYADAEPVSAKGKSEPLAAWEPVQARSRFGVDLFQHARTPLIGRERELNVLKEALRRMREARSPQLVTLVGVPGIGKSRLVYELMRAVGNDPSGLVTWRQGRSLPYGDGVSFWALAEIVKAQAGILETDSEGQAEAKLARAVQTQIDNVAEAQWVERHMRPLAGLGGGDGLADRQGEAFAAWRRFFEALADTRPAVLVLEDLQWADEGLLDFVDSLLEWITDVPLLLITTARPELLERRPGWAGGKANAMTLSLSSLSERETVRLVRGLVEGQLPAETERSLVARAAGNPLYAEQYARVWEERGDAGTLPLPETVHGLIAARLDGLSAREKTVLQNAAVFGKVFWQGAIVAVDGIDATTAAACLHALQRKQFVQRVRHSSVEDETEYGFRHVLLRDVSYGQMPRAIRAEKHERAADWIESLGRAEDHAEVLAYHYVSALELGGSAGRSSDELTTQALLSLIRAAERTAAVNAFPSAATYYERALQLLEQNDPRRPTLLFGYARALFETGDDQRADALEQARRALVAADEVASAAEADTLLAGVAWYEGRRGAVDEHLQHAMTQIREYAPSPAKARVLASVARYRMLASEHEAAIEAGHQALEMATTFGLEETRADALITVGMARFQAGDDAGPDDIKQGLDVALAANELTAAGRAYHNLAVAAAGNVETLALLTAGEELRLRLGDREGARFTRADRAAVLFSLGRWDEALPLIEDFIAECDAGRPSYQEAGLRRARAWTRLARGDTDGAVEDIEKALALAREAKDPQVLIETVGVATLLYSKLGRLDEAKSIGCELLAAHPRAPWWSSSFGIAAHKVGLAASVQDALRDARHETRWRGPVPLAAAEGRFVEASEIATSIGQNVIAAELRVAAAEAFLDERHHGDARTQLEHALAFYRSVDAIRFIREAEVLLATIQSESKVPTAQPHM